jgi:hypothetical protein
MIYQLDYVVIINFQTRSYLEQFSVIRFYRPDEHEAFKKYVNDDMDGRIIENVADESMTACIEDKPYYQ